MGALADRDPDEREAAASAPPARAGAPGDDRRRRVAREAVELRVRELLTRERERARGISRRARQL
ncbi:hypothetical protein [Conexibacter woesei]|uniref:hypothetical protein n=1 Tax=Conexibacter woesei TaxID=191495 RepID=UPI0011D2B6DC|nr:hypothetical protein [Conexibacter woesei]